MNLRWSFDNTKVEELQSRIGKKVVAFGLPPGISCPARGVCQSYCYAQGGRQALSNCLDRYFSNWANAQKGKGFEWRLRQDLDELQCQKVGAIRMHDAGDFFTARYMRQWIAAAREHPSIVFYVYTKCLPYLEENYSRYGHPENFRLTLSYGGRYDSDIPRAAERWWLPTVQVYPTPQELQEDLRACRIEADASHTDLWAYEGTPRSLGIAFHGCHGNAQMVRRTP